MTEDDPLVEQLTALLDSRLLDPLDILLEGDELIGTLRHQLRERAGQWADEMREGDDTAATRAMTRLVASLYSDDLPFRPPIDFWWSPFGQAVAIRLGHPSEESLSYATAGAMLGITRQAVHDLVRRGKLPRHPDGGVPSDAVRERLRRTKGIGHWFAGTEKQTGAPGAVSEPAPEQDQQDQQEQMPARASEPALRQDHLPARASEPVTDRGSGSS